MWPETEPAATVTADATKETGWRRWGWRTEIQPPLHRQQSRPRGRCVAGWTCGWTLSSSAGTSGSSTPSATTPSAVRETVQHRWTSPSSPPTTRTCRWDDNLMFIARESRKNHTIYVVFPSDSFISSTEPLATSPSRTRVLPVLRADAPQPALHAVLWKRRSGTAASRGDDCWRVRLSLRSNRRLNFNSTASFLCLYLLMFRC